MDNLKEATLQSELRFKDLVINPCHRSVLINNNRIDLTTKEFDLLYFLAIHPGWAFTKSQIYETVWGEEYVCNQHAVENIIYNLRRKMAINSTSINYIQTLASKICAMPINVKISTLRQIPLKPTELERFLSEIAHMTPVM